MVENARTRGAARSWKGIIAVLAALAWGVLMGVRGWGGAGVDWCPRGAELRTNR